MIYCQQVFGVSYNCGRANRGEDRRNLNYCLDLKKIFLSLPEANFYVTILIKEFLDLCSKL